jgi:hypothetical protein
MFNYYLWIISFFSYILLYLKKNKFNLENQIKYNDFADKRQLNFMCCNMCCKINNFNDVISNIVYTFGGLFQIFYRDNFYLGISSILVSIGSAYYHLNPNMRTLFYDRFPMQIAFTYLIFDNVPLESYEKIFMLFYSFGSVIYWNYTHDLILYALFQLSMILYLIIFNTNMFIPVLFYIIAKICEDKDKQIYDKLNNNFSGHTLKHIISGLALFFI